MLTQTVTIYNKYGTDNPARWGRCVLQGVHFKGGSGVSTATTGVSGGQVEALLIVPKNDGYVSPAGYRAAEDHAGLWTLQDGDLLLPGEGPEPGTGDIRRDIAGCKRITDFVEHIYGSRLDHWEVTAR